MIQHTVFLVLRGGYPEMVAFPFGVLLASTQKELEKDRPSGWLFWVEIGHFGCFWEAKRIRTVHTYTDNHKPALYTCEHTYILYRQTGRQASGRDVGKRANGQTSRKTDIHASIHAYAHE